MNFILRFQQSDGGFAGREGGSDLYYTSFAVRTLALLDALDHSRCQNIATYLKSAAASRQEYSLIDLVSWLYSVMTVQLIGNLEPLAGDTKSFADEVTASLEAFRRPDGGYAKTNEGGVGSTITLFWRRSVMSCSEDRCPTSPASSASFSPGGETTAALSKLGK